MPTDTDHPNAAPTTIATGGDCSDQEVIADGG